MHEGKPNLLFWTTQEGARPQMLHSTVCCLSLGITDQAVEDVAEGFVQGLFMQVLRP